MRRETLAFTFSAVYVNQALKSWTTSTYIVRNFCRRPTWEVGVLEQSCYLALIECVLVYIRSV